MSSRSPGPRRERRWRSGAQAVRSSWTGPRLRVGRRLARNLREIRVSAGGGDDRVSLSEVVRSAFSNLGSIAVSGDDGDDTLIGSDFADVLSGGGGADVVRGAPARTSSFPARGGTSSRAGTAATAPRSPEGGAGS